MPLFSPSSSLKLSTCHQDLQRLFYEVIKHIDCSILEGHRGEEEQNKAFDQGFSKLKYPNGNHNAMPSNAVDVMEDPIDYHNEKRIYWFAGYVQSVAQQLKEQGKMTHSIRWGGNWENTSTMDSEKFFDGAHFELIP